MATKFTADVTRDIPLATANPAAAAEAISLKGKALGQAIGFLGTTAYDAYKGFQDQSFEQQMTEEKERFTGFEAAQRIRQGEELLTSSRAERRSAFETQGIEAGAEKDVAVQELSSRLDTMKETYAQKRIGLGEYLARQQALSKEWIAKFPGRADQIRQEVARISGVRGIEDYAFQTYLKDRFDAAESAGKQEAQAAKAERDSTLKRAEALLTGGYVKGFTNAAQVANAIQSNDPNVLNALNQLDTEAALARNNAALETQIKVNRLTLEEGGKTFTGNLIVSANNASMQGLVKIRSEFAPLVTEIEQVKAKNGGTFTVADVDAYRAKLAPFQAKATGVINASFDAVYRQLATSDLAKRNSADFQARSKELQDSRKAVLEMVNSDDLGVVASMLESIGKVNKDTIASSMQMMQIVNEQRKASGISGPDLFMFTNNPELFKKQYPEAYRILSAGAPVMSNSIDRMTAISGSATVADMSRVTKDSFAVGTTPPVSPELRAVAIEKAIGLNPAASLAAAGGGVFPDRPQMVGALSTIVSSIPKESVSGPHILYSVKNFNNIKKSYDTMSPEEKSLLKQSWNNSVARLSGERSISAVVNKELEEVRARGLVNVQLIATPDGRYSFMLERKDPRGTADIFGTGVDLEQTRLNSVVRYANAITDLNNLFSDGKVPATTAGAGEQQPATTGGALVTNQMRATSNIEALQRELKRVETKPSWMSESAWKEQVTILKNELVKEQAKVQ